MPTDLKKTQGFISTDPRTSSRQVQELERSTQAALKTVENNTPSFMGYFFDSANLGNNNKVKLYRFTDMPSERINVNGKDPEGEALKFEKPGYYLVNISTAARLGLGVGTCTLAGRIDGRPVVGAFIRSLNNASANIPFIGSGIIRVPQGKTLNFVVTLTSLSNGNPETVRFTQATNLTSFAFRPNFSVVFVRPLEGSR